MSESDNRIQIDAKFIGLVTFLVTQFGFAVWWAGEKSAQIDDLQDDIDKLTSHVDKQLDRIELKLDRMNDARTSN